MSPVLGSDTWGISGPSFLALYVLLGIAVGLTAYLANLPRGAATDPNPPRPERLSPTQLALMSGGPVHAVTVALAELRSQGLLDVNGKPVRVSGLDKPSLDRVPAAVRREISSVARLLLSPGLLARRTAVAAALAKERERLEDYGLVARARPRSHVRAAYLATAALALLGLARIAGGSANHHAIAYIVIVTVATAVVIPVLVAKARRNRLTADGRDALKTVRKANDHLEPKLRPSWSTYGGPSIVLATALFGGAVIFAADPVFAATVNARDADFVATGGGSGFFSGGGGSGCGGGSSCGGGGGCGGGGCGGGGCGG